MERQEIAPGVFAVYGPDGTANAGFIVGDEVLVVDTMMTPTMSRELVRHIQEVTGREVSFVINTHYHGDHTFGNQFFATATLMAHQAVRSRMEELGESLITRMLRFRPELKDEIQELRVTLPCLTFSGGLTFYLGDKRVEVFYIGHPAHTGGDSMVYLPQDQVLFSGDLLFTRTIPAMQPDGSSIGWLQSLGQIEGMAVEKIVPGHGALSTLKEIGEQKDYISTLRQEVGRCMSNGMNREDTTRAVNLEKFASWEQPARNEGNIGIVYAEMEKEKGG